MNEMTLRDPRRFAPVMGLLLGLFAFRVTAQLLLAIVDIPYLPPFEQWHSDAMPYALLLMIQLLILWIMGKQTLRFYRGTVIANRTVGIILCGLGLVYLLGMVARFVLGITILTDSRWFTNHIPTMFHLVLACFVLLISVYHLQFSKPLMQTVKYALAKLTPWVIYPVVVTFGLTFYVLLAFVWKLPAAISSYTPVVISAILISVLEYARPHRNTWLPNRGDIKNDALYMGIVQLLLPKLIALAFFFIVIAQFRNFVPGLTDLWPHHWPVAAQALLMVLLADLMRYWLHRLAHNNKILWRLHAVHHSPGKLYWLNVARFHPLEKALQMVFDVLPFMLMGVSEYVVGLYFVFYAINGFFQHSNIELRFGWFNYLISSAELHRWHHSKQPHESNSNYGNNLIVWDILFGSYFLPKDRQINDLGLLAEDYPQDFAHQLKAPFVRESAARE